MAFDVNALTLGEIDKIETLSGLSISALADDANPKGKMLAAMVFVAKRREQLAAGEKPSFTFNQAMEMGMKQAQQILGMSAPAPDAAGIGAGTEPTAEELDAEEDPTGPEE